MDGHRKVHNNLETTILFYQKLLLKGISKTLIFNKISITIDKKVQTMIPVFVHCEEITFSTLQQWFINSYHK